MQTIITRDVLIEELGKIPLSCYPKLFQILKNFENEEIKENSNVKIDKILENILSLKGILKNEKMSSIELQKSVSDFIKYS
jgi:hypothetical protein